MKNRADIKKKIQSMSEDELIDLFIKASEADWYKEQLAILNKLRFASKSEKIVCGQLNLFNEAEEIHDKADEEMPEEKKRKKKKTREANFSALPTKIFHHEIEDKHCEICGDEMKELAPQVIDVLKYQPARYTVERHIVHQYLCPACTDENLEAEIVIAPGAPKRLIKGSVTSPSVVAGIAFNKYVSGVPLYRQEQELKRQKVEISRANMSNWLMKSGEMLEPLYQRMLEDLRKQSHVHMDETTMVVLEDKQIDGREKSYIWMAASGKHEEEQIVLYQYNQNRKHAHAKELLEEAYCGGVHCDGYEAYHKWDKVAIFGCMAHARRYFIEAMEVSPLYKEAKKMSIEQLQELCHNNPQYGDIIKVVSIMKYLFACEARYIEEGLNPSEIEKRRQKEQKPKLDEIFSCIITYEEKHTSQTKAKKAVNYALNQWQYLTNYLNDGAAEITNNRGERYIKPFVIGRKAWLFSNTKSGAKMSSIYYSIIESAKQNHLDIHKYLEYVLTEIQEHSENFDYKLLLPYSKELPESLRVK